MPNNKITNWLRGLFIILSKIDPSFEMIKTDSIISPSQEALTIERLSAAVNQMPAKQMNDFLASLASKLQSAEVQSENSRKIIDKIHLHLSHQDENKRHDLSKADIDTKAAALGVNCAMIDVDQCAEIYDGIEEMFFPNQCPRESLLEGAVKLSLFAGNKHEAVAYLNRHANNQILSLESYLQAIKVTLPTSMSWTPIIWQGLFKNNKPTYLHDLYFKLLPYAPEVEKAYHDLGKSITPKEPLTTITKIAVGSIYQDDDSGKNTMSLFLQHGVSKDQYNWYKKLVIKDDGGLIPDITIQGKDISKYHSPFYLKKLDKHDPIAAIIGDMTGCCEKINGPGKSYLHAALTQNFAGYYVLYDKRKMKGEGVVAHCIAWRVDDYIVYSSVETNINYRNQLPLVADFFYMLANQLMYEHKINRVFVWEWHDHTPPFLGVKQEAPSLNDHLMKISQDLGIPVHGNNLKETFCIADCQRPYLSLYSRMRNLPVLSPHSNEAMMKSFSKGELIQILYSLSMFVDELELQPYLDETGLTKQQLINNKQAFLKMVEMDKSPIYRNDELSLDVCFNMLRLPANTNNIMIIQPDMDPFSLLINATLYYDFYLLSNKIFHDHYLSKALTNAIITKVVDGFIFSDGIRLPFETVDVTDEQSLRCYLQKLFDFCLLAVDMMGAAVGSTFYIDRFNTLYDMIYPKHPVTCMQVLRYAILHDNDPFINAMLQKGIDLNNDLEFTQTPLILAIENNKPAIVNKLLRYGADKDQRSLGHAPNRGVMPLEVAAREGMNDIFNRLIIEGANPNFNSQLDNSNLLHHVPKLDKPFWVSYLVNRGLDINQLSESFPNKEHGGQTPLYCAASAGRFDVFKRMLKHGADINFQNKQGNTMLHVAVLRMQIGVVSMLIKAGASLTIKNAKGETAYDIFKTLPIYTKLAKNLPEEFHVYENMLSNTKASINVSQKPAIAADLKDQPYSPTLFRPAKETHESLNYSSVSSSSSFGFSR